MTLAPSGSWWRSTLGRCALKCLLAVEQGRIISSTSHFRRPFFSVKGASSVFLDLAYRLRGCPFNSAYSSPQKLSGMEIYPARITLHVSVCSQLGISSKPFHRRALLGTVTNLCLPHPPFLSSPSFHCLGKTHRQSIMFTEVFMNIVSKRRSLKIYLVLLFEHTLTHSVVLCV